MESSESRKPLTDAVIRGLKPTEKPYKRTDAKGLLLEVRPTGKKLWRYRFRINGKESLYALGEYPDRPLPRNESEAEATQRRSGGVFTLAEARTERDRCRHLVKNQQNPARQRSLQRMVSAESSANTFQAVAKEWLAANEAGWSESYRSQVTRIVAGDLIGELGAYPMAEIKAAHLLAALRKIERRGAKTIAARARFLSSEIWRYAVATLRAESDLGAALRGAIVAPQAGHHPALKASELPDFLRALDSYSGRTETVTALRLMLLLFPRPGELLSAEWSEIDLETDKPLWRIPARKMKMREDHLIPLPAPAADLFRALKLLTGHRKHVFPHRDIRDGHMTDAALRQALRVMKYSRRLTPHGFRATAATALSEMGYRSELIDKQLAHAERNKVKAAYLRSPLLDERRAMLEAWAQVIESLRQGGKVVPIKRSA